MDEIQRQLAEMPEVFFIEAVRHQPGELLDSGEQKCKDCGLLLMSGVLSMGGMCTFLWSGPVIVFNGGMTQDNGNWNEATNCSDTSN